MNDNGPQLFRYYGNVLSIAQAGASSDGYLSSADWNRFNSGIGSGGGGGGGGTDTAISASAVTSLVWGQDYIDVTFTPQGDANWKFVELNVVNMDDIDPLNIWPGIITSKTPSGFRLHLSGVPNTDNYFLHWAIAGAPAVITLP